MRLPRNLLSVVLKAANRCGGPIADSEFEGSMYRPFREPGKSACFVIFTYCRGFVPWQSDDGVDAPAVPTPPMETIPPFNIDAGFQEKRPHVAALTCTPGSNESETAAAMTAG